jgi:serine/threonine protein kinase
VPESSDDDDPPPGASADLGSAASELRAMAAAPPAPALAPGQRVAGKYRVERVLGRGGMGVVYLARDERLGREVALKLGRAIDRGALVRLEREARLLASISHPNVVTVYEVGEADGRLFLAMEHVPGGTARTWCAADGRTPREVIALYAAAGDGLAAAHAAGLVHRDFKPDNVLVGDDGRPRVADFGIARGGDRACAETEGRSSHVSRVVQGSVLARVGRWQEEQAERGPIEGVHLRLPPEAGVRRAAARRDRHG